ncbi:MAG TPA: carboxypeptidase regulatory-like domain-containing protein [Acidobacteriaceae bacterium]|nr:carboxypeptidase regulatory-like domain-containing protein [Acidobacteriaceae bacterium]
MGRSGIFPVALVVILSLVSGVIARRAQSQEVTAAVSGEVTDPSGAVVASAAITATDVSRGTKFETRSDAAGEYYLPRLPVGSYTLQAEAPGFQTVVHSAFTLVLNQTARIDFKMPVGKVSQVVTVTAAGPILQEQSTEVSTVIDAATNVALPLASRNYLQLTLLAPGVTTTNPENMEQSQRIDTAEEPYVNGNRAQDNNYLLDGMDNNQTSDNLVAYTPSPDAIEEFNMITQNAPAEFGNFMGGIVNVTTKTGTNQFHGDVFEFFRNDFLNANNWFNKLENVEAGSDVAPRPGLRWNMFGFTLGGPVKRNTLFFFVDYQGQRFEQYADSAFSAFTASERVGDFGQLCTDPSVGGSFDGNGNCTGGTQLVDPYTGANIPFNQLQSYINSGADPTLTAQYNSGSGKVAQNLFTSPYYPSVSSLTNSTILNNYVFSTRTPLNVDQGDVRVDWSLSDSNHLFARYSQELQVNFPVNTLLSISVNNGQADIQSGVIDWAHTFNSDVVNDGRFGVNWVQLLNNSSATPDIGNLGDTLGIANGNEGGPGLLEIDLGPSSGIGGAGNIQNWSDTIIQANDNLDVTHGHHVMQMGFQFLRERMDDFYAGNAGILGDRYFGGNFTGTPDSDFYLGMVNTSAQYFPSIAGGTGEPAWGQRSSIFGVYAEDTWRALQGLVLNYGVRYQAHTPWTEAHGEQLNYNPVSGQPLYPAGSSLPSIAFPGYAPKPDSNRALYNGYYGIADFEPRLGFAYTTDHGRGRTVVRGAYTMSDYLEGTGNALRPTLNIPFNIQMQLDNFCSGGTPGCNPAQLLITNPLLINTSNLFTGAILNLWAPNVRPAVAQQWNLTVQRQIDASTAFEVAYLGQHSTHLMVPESLLQLRLLPGGATQPSPYLAGNPALTSTVSYVTATYSDGNASYNGLQAVLQRRLANGLEGQISYAWSHCLTNSIGFYGDVGQASNASAYWQNLYDPGVEWGSCYFDLHNNLTTNFVYNLPFGRGRQLASHVNRATNAIINNWTFAGIYTFRGGFPLTVVDATDYSGTNSRGERADCLGNVEYLKQRTISGVQWVNANTYANPRNGTFGTCGISTLRGPGLDDVDLSIQRDFPTFEGQKLQFRAEGVNALNHPIFNAPNMYCSGSAGAACSAGFGLIGSTQGERNIQFALKYYF